MTDSNPRATGNPEEPTQSSSQGSQPGGAPSGDSPDLDPKPSHGDGQPRGDRPKDPNLHDHEPKGGGKSKEGGGPKGFLFIAALLFGLIVVASLSDGDMYSEEVETNYYKVVEHVLDNQLKAESFTFYSDTKVFRAEFVSPVDGKKRVKLSFATDEEVNRFRKEALEAFNERHGQTIDWKVEKSQSVLSQVFWATLPWLIILFVLYFLFFRHLRASSPGGNLLSFGRSRARVATQESATITFADVAGVEEAKCEVSEIIQFLKNPRKFQRLGGRVPRGVMLVGSPGTGKTLLAKAIAGEAGVPFYSISGSDFVEMFVGVGAARVRDLFKQARENSPCIVFLDEVDAVGRRRGAGLGGGHDEREQTLNAILVEMDGFESDAGIIFIAATNRPDVLDPALLRPGRFDREIMIDLPDVAGRTEILEVHTRHVKLDGSVDLQQIARATPMFSGAELAALVNEAAIIAAIRDQEAIRLEDLEEARDKIRWGRQKRSRILAEEDRRITAFHEAGHAIIAHLHDSVEPLHKVTIIPRGMSLGATMQLPERDRYHMSRKQALGNLMMFYGGRVAEEIFCGDVTSGASNDIERATELARKMVCEWGMSENISPIRYAENEETVFLGREVTRNRNHSEALSQQIDQEVRRIIDECYAATKKALRENEAAVERIAEALLELETLTGEQVRDLVEGRPLREVQSGSSSSGSAAKPASPEKGRSEDELLTGKSDCDTGRSDIG